MKIQLLNPSKNFFLLVAFVFATVSNIYSQNTIWVNPFISNSTFVNAVDVEVDPTGNSYTVGNFSGTVNFNYNGTTTNMTSVGGQDIFIVKNDANGGLVWVKTIGGTLDDVPSAVDVRSSGVVVAGTFKSANMDFDPGNGSVPLSSSGGSDVFVLKLDLNGVYQWAERAGGTPDELMTDIELDGSSNIYLAGSFATLMDFFSNTNTTSHGGTDAFVCKLDAAGTFQWVKAIGGAGSDVAKKLTVVGPNVLASTDIGSGSTTFDFGSGTNTGTFSGTGTNGIVSHFSDAGVYQGNYQFTGNTSLVKMISTGSTNLIIGTFTGTMDINPGAATNNVTATGTRDMFVVSVSGLGGGSYMNHFIVNGSASSQILPTNLVHQVGANSGILDLYITGSAKGSFNLGGTAANDISGPNTTNEYAFLVKYHFDAAGSIFGNMVYGHEINKIYVTTDNSRGNGIAIKVGDVLTCGFWSSATINQVTYFPGGTIYHSPSSTYAMGFLQYIYNCTNPTTVASTSTYAICKGFSATLNASGATNYLWNNGKTTSSIVVSPTVTTTYTLTGTVAGGCSAKDSVKITIKPSPNITVVATNSAICAGASINITASGGTTYIWNNGKTTAVVTESPIVNTVYSVIGVTNGCGTIKSVTITANPLPTVAISPAGPLSICSGTKVTFTASGANTYSWMGGPATATYSVIVTTARAYTVTGTATNGCSAKKSVTVTLLPVNFTITASPTTLCLGQTLTVTATGTAGNSYYLGGTYFTSTIPYSPITTGNQNVIIAATASNGCSKNISTPITVNPYPVFTVSSSQGSVTCPLTSVTLTSTATTNITWSNGGTQPSTVVTPSVTTSYTITSVSLMGCAAKQSILVTITPVVTPSISVTPAIANVCPGTSTNFAVVSTINGGSLPKYQWYKNGSAISSATTTAYTAGAGTVNNNDQFYCQLISNASCATPATDNSNISTVVISNSVVPSILISANQTDICTGTNVVFTGIAINGGTTPAYQWKLNGGNVGTNSSTYSNSSLTNGAVVTCVLTSSSACANPTTATSNSVSIAVSPYVIPSVVINASQTSICQGSTVSFTATPTNGGSSTSYQWKLNGANAGTNAATYSNSNPSTGDRVSCILTSNNACASPSTASSNSVTITVMPSITPAITIDASQTSICIGGSVSFSAFAVNGGGSPVYQWKINGNNAGTNSAFFSSSSLSDGDIVTCFLTSNASCASPLSILSNPVTISVGSNLVPSVTINASQTIICPGSSVNFTALSVNEGASPTYQWKVNAINAGVNSPNFSSGALNNGDKVTCVLTSALSCVSPATATSNTVTISVVSSLVPSVSVTALQATVCSGLNAGFTANSINGGNTPSFQWKVNSNNVGTNISTYTANNFSNGDIITCELISSESCASPNTVTSLPLTISVNQTPSDAVTINDITLTAVETGATYQWGDCNFQTAITGEINQSYGATYNSSFVVIVTKNGCSDTSDCYAINTVGIQKNNILNQLVKIYPNPAHDHLYLNNEINGNISFEMYNISGELIYNKVVTSGELQIDLSLFSKGLYLVKIASADKVQLEKLLIE